MEKDERRSGARASFNKFRKRRPKAVNLDDAPLVASRFLDEDSTWPLVLEPANPDVDVFGWVDDNRDDLRAKLTRHGAILFRGFGIEEVPQFERLARAVCDHLYGDYGDLPREEKGEKIYHSTPYPKDKMILFHNESSHMSSWPRRQFFYCVQAAPVGGETPIVDCRELYKRLDPELQRRFEEQGLLYVRNFIEGFDVHWTDFFHTEDKEEVERKCREAEMECEWIEGGLRVRQRAPAVILHPETGEKVFFNQIQLHHASSLEPEVRSSLLELYGEERLPRNVYYGDGSPISDATMERIGDLLLELASQYPWQAGDVLALDNMLIAHARNPFDGPRKIVVAMGDMFQAEDLEPLPQEARA